MARKKWTPTEDADEAILLIREKRKWQIALRRYVLENHKSASYAPFFALDHNRFRQWIELQFDQSLSWDNFSSHWQFDHVVPVAYFDFSNEQDLRLCWNFTNIRVAKTDKNDDARLSIDVLAAKHYFNQLYQNTSYSICGAMVEKIEQIERSQLTNNKNLEDFISSQQFFLEQAQRFTPDDFERLNTGTDISVLLAEKEFLKKYGS